MNLFLGVLIIAIGGLSAASFYLPIHKVKGWSWETYWIIQGFFSWIVMPFVFAWITTPDLFGIISTGPTESIFLAFIFGAMWGVGGLTFGLSMRYLGMSLGMSISLGFCAAFGTLIPPIYAGNVMELFTGSGLLVLIGVIVCLVGITICGYAGVLKEKQMSDEEKKKAIKEFALVKGFAVAIFAGIMSSCMAFAIEAGQPLAEAALNAGTQELFMNNPTFIFAMGGGFITNFVWCMFLNIKNKTFNEYGKGPTKTFLLNYILAALGGTMWYLQFFFLGMGRTKMGAFDFASWSIHMAFVIVFSNMWGMILKEWKGSSNTVFRMLYLGIAILIISTIVIGYANFLKA